jgi:hypothetical protein
MVKCARMRRFVVLSKRQPDAAQLLFRAAAFSNEADTLRVKKMRQNKKPKSAGDR